MLIVGELINASRKSMKPMITEADAEGVIRVAREQVEGGADFVDVNAGIFVGKEPEYLRWLVETIQSEVDVPCCIDSPDPEAIRAALAVHKGTAMINSISLERDRYQNMLPIVAGTDLKVIALCMRDGRMPETAAERMEIADELVNDLLKNDVKVENIYVDPLVQPIGTRDDFGLEFLNSVELIKSAFPGIHTMCGLSNISFGLPERKFANRTFMAMAITKGLDGAIMNPKDKDMMASIVAAETLNGRDKFCENYLNAYRDGIIGTKGKK